MCSRTAGVLQILRRRLRRPNDHLLQELPVLVEMARRKVLDTSRIVTRVVPLEADAINQTLDALEQWSSDVRTVIVP